MGYAETFKALSDPARRQILELLKKLPINRKKARLQSWQQNYMLGMFTLATNPDVFEQELVDSATVIITSMADDFVKSLDNNGYGVALEKEDFYWGSNGVAANKGMVLMHAYILTKDEKYLNAPERRQVSRTLSRRHRLAGAYRAYQDLLVRMGSRWTIPIITGWIDDLPQYLDDAADEGEQLEELWEFDIINDRIYFFFCCFFYKVAVSLSPVEIFYLVA